MLPIDMKRGREEKVSSIVSIADYLFFLSHTPEFESVKSNSPSRIFECKTCNKRFSSFQALGGHRASHKKQKSVNTESTQTHGLPLKPKTHECGVCGLKFMVGQALGGHMRRHRVADSDVYELTQSVGLTLFPSLELPNKEKSRDFLCLDLNLTPRENEWDSMLKKVVPEVICFL